MNSPLKPSLSKDDIAFVGQLLLKNSQTDIDKLVCSLAVQLAHCHQQRDMHRYLNPIFFLAGLLIGYYIGA